MLQPQRLKLLGDLYYGDDTPEYVAPPIKEIKELGAAKEQDYLLTKDKVNEIDKITRTLPYIQQSSGVYNEWANKVSGAISSVNADNYEDNVLNVTQVANDMYNKWGGNELVKQAGEYQAESSRIDKAYADGVINNPEKVAWKKQQLAESTKSISMDANGYYTSPKIQGVDLVPDVSIATEVEAILKGWETDKTYERGTDGKIKVNSLTPGYLSTLNKEFITEQELYNSAVSFVNSQPKMQAYLNDEVNFQMRNVNPTVESIFAIANPLQKEAIFGKKDISMEEAQMMIASGQVDLKQQLGVLVKKGIVDQALVLPVQKYAHDKETMDTMKDDIFLEELKFNADIRKKQMETESLDNSLVTVEPFQAVQELRPDDIVQLKKQKEVLKERRKEAQAIANTTNKALLAGKEGVTADQLVEQNQKITKLDEDIQEIYEQEQQVAKTFEKESNIAGIDLNKEYTAVLPKARESAIAKNKEVLTSSNYSINITQNVIKKGGKDYIVFKGRNEAKDKTMLAEDVLANKASGISKGVGEDSNKYIYRSKDDTSNFNKANNVIDDGFFDERGMPNQNTLVRYSPSNSRTTGDPYVEDFYKTPTSGEYKSMLASAYNLDERVSIMDNHTDSYTSDKFIIPKSGLKPLDKIEKERGKFNSPIISNLSSIFVTGETTKTALKQLQILEDADNESFRRTPDQYSIKVGDKTVNLGTYLKETYDIPDLSAKYIDWGNSTSKLVLATDREAGQKYGLTISLTPEGIKEAKDDAFTKTNNIKLVGLNTTKNVPTEQAKIKKVLIGAYGEVAEDTSEYGVSVKNQMGRLMADQMPAIGGEIDRLNLYTVPPGTRKPIDLMGSKYEITTTDKNLDSTDILDVDFHLGLDNAGTKVVFAQNAKGESDWYDESDIEKSNQAILDAKGDKTKTALAMANRLSKVAFNSPNDLKAFIGSRVLANQYKEQKAAQAEQMALNPYTQFRMSTKTKTSGAGSYTIKSNTITSNDYSQYSTMVKTMYGNKGDKEVKLLNNTTGKMETISSRVNQSDLVNISSYVDKGSTATDNNYPYMNRSVANNSVKLIKTFGLVNTGGFRGETSHEGQAEASDNSMHKYGLSFDARADVNGLKFYDKVVNNPSLMAQYGIAKLYKHEVAGVTHIHTELIPEDN